MKGYRDSVRFLDGDLTTGSRRLDHFGFFLPTAPVTPLVMCARDERKEHLYSRYSKEQLP